MGAVATAVMVAAAVARAAVELVVAMAAGQEVTVEWAETRVVTGGLEVAIVALGRAVMLELEMGTAGSVVAVRVEVAVEAPAVAM